MFLASDNSQNIIKVLFVDFTKAFDAIDHNVLLNKFVNCGMPEHVVVWSLDFLSGRRQFVRIADSVSSISDCDSWSIGLFDVSCFMRGCSVFLYTFCVYSRKLVHVQ